jgi:hypothetical protein
LCQSIRLQSQKDRDLKAKWIKKASISGTPLYFGFIVLL